MSRIKGSYNDYPVVKRGMLYANGVSARIIQLESGAYKVSLSLPLQGHAHLESNELDEDQCKSLVDELVTGT